MPDGGTSGPSLVWLDRPISTSAKAADDPRLSEALRLSNKGEYGEAARIAEAMLAEGLGDVQVLARYLFGVFVSKGFPVLPRIIQTMTRASEPGLASEGKTRNDVEVSLGWLLRTIRDRIDFHHTVKDPTWKAWIDACEVSICDAICETCGRLMKILEALAPASQGLKYAAGLESFAQSTLRGLIPKPAPPPAPPKQITPPPPPEPAPEMAAEVAPESAPLGRQDKQHAPPQAKQQQGKPASEPITIEPAGAPELDSPALRQLRRKLDVFQALVFRGDLGRAAIVARDLEQIVNHFDPRVYLPRLFAPFFKRLASAGDALTPYWESEGSVGWRAMEQLYKIDLDAFLDEDEK